MFAYVSDKPALAATTLGRATSGRFGLLDLVEHAVADGLQIHLVPHSARVLVLDEPRGGPIVEASGTDSISAAMMRQRHAELGKPLPQRAFLDRTGLPSRLEHLVRGERPAVLEQPPRECDRLVRWQRLLGHRLDARRTVRQRATEFVTRPSLSGATAGIPISVFSHGHISIASISGTCCPSTLTDALGRCRTRQGVLTSRPPLDRHPDEVMTPTSNTVDGVLRRAAARFPDRVALHFGDDTLTYRELDDAVTRATAHLLSLGLAKGDRVAGYGTNSHAYVIGYLAAARAGLVHVPINYALRAGELSYLLEQSGARAVLVDPALAENLDAVIDVVPAEFVLPLRDADDSLFAVATSGDVPALDVSVEDSDLVQFLYTSGTTSKPKGAMMTHRALIHEYTSSIIALDLDADDNPLICMPLYHSAGMHVFMVPYLAVGATVRLMPAPDIPEILRLVEEYKIGSLFLAPTVWVPLAAHPDLETRDLSSLRKAQYGASIMPVTVLQRLRERYPDLGFYNCFGQSEIGPLATVLRPEEHDARPASCGRPVFFVETRVVDADGNDVPVGEPGEILYRSPQLCQGYWDNPTATEETFRDGWFHSGDLVTRDEEGYVTVVDRIKDVINTGGILVASREVEDAIYTHDAVAEVAVIGTPDDKWIEAITAVVVLRAEAVVTEAELIDHVKQRLAPFKVPKLVKFVEELPRNQSGKLLKRELRA